MHPLARLEAKVTLGDVVSALGVASNKTKRRVCNACRQVSIIEFW